MVGLPLARVLLPSVRQGVLGSGSSATRCGPSGAAPDSYCWPNRQIARLMPGARPARFGAPSTRVPRVPEKLASTLGSVDERRHFYHPLEIGSMAMAAQTPLSLPHRCGK